MENNETNQVTPTIEQPAIVPDLTPVEPVAVEPIKEPKKNGFLIAIIVIALLIAVAYCTKVYVLDAKTTNDKKETNNTTDDTKIDAPKEEKETTTDNTTTKEETPTATVMEVNTELKNKIINMYEDHLAFTRETFTNVSEVTGAKVASRIVFYDNGTKLSDLQRATIADKYKVDVAYMGEAYLAKSKVEAEYLSATGKNLITFDSDDHLKFISEYDFYIDAIGSHGYTSSDPKTFGISDAGVFDLIFIDSVTKNVDGTYSVKASMYDAFNEFEADEEAIQNKYTAYINGTKDVKDFDFKETTSKYGTVFKVVGDVWYFVSNSVK